MLPVPHMAIGHTVTQLTIAPIQSNHSRRGCKMANAAGQDTTIVGRAVPGPWPCPVQSGRLEYITVRQQVLRTEDICIDSPLLDHIHTIIRPVHSDGHNVMRPRMANYGNRDRKCVRVTNYWPLKRIAGSRTNRIAQDMGNLLNRTPEGFVDD